MKFHLKSNRLQLIFYTLIGVFLSTSTTLGADMAQQNWDKVFTKSDKVDVKKSPSKTDTVLNWLVIYTPQKTM